VAARRADSEVSIWHGSCCWCAWSSSCRWRSSSPTSGACWSLPEWAGRRGSIPLGQPARPPLSTGRQMCRPVGGRRLSPRAQRTTHGTSSSGGTQHDGYRLPRPDGRVLRPFRRPHRALRSAV